MTKSPKLKYQPPDSWEDFESLLQDIFRKKWDDPELEKNGRLGQKQYGVDLYGHENQGPDYSGIQSKLKDTYPEKKVTYKQVTDEVKKADTFKPTLGKYYIATSARKDAVLQQKVRVFNEQRIKDGKFKVRIYFWEDILELAQVDHEIMEQYFGEQYFSSDIQVLQGSQAVEELIREARQDIDDLNPESGLKRLEAIKRDRWVGMSDTLKFKLLSNLGVGYSYTNQPDKAADCFVEAYSYAPNENTANTNLAWALGTQNEKQQATDILNEVLRKSPGNSLAYVNLVGQSEEPDFSKVLVLVPERYRKDPAIALALAEAAHERDNPTEAEKHLKIANAGDMKLPSQMETKYCLAEVRIRKTLKVKDVTGLKQLDPTSLKDLKAAIKIMKECWNLIKNRDIRKYRLDILVRIAHFHRLIGELDTAKDLLAQALAIDITHAGANTLMGLIEYDDGNIDKAVSYYEKAITSGGSDAALLLADLHEAQGTTDQAIKALKKIFRTTEDPDELKHATVLMAGAYIKAGNIPEAEKITQGFLKKHPDDVRILVEQAKIIGVKSGEDAYNTALQDIPNNLGEATRDDKTILADELHKASLFEDAIKLYEQVVDPKVNSDLAHRLLHCYYRVGNYKAALEVASNLRSNYGPQKFVTEIESYIYEQIQDYDKAKEACEDYLKAFPDSRWVLLRLAVLNERIGNAAEVEQFLAEFEYGADLSMTDLMNIVALCLEHNRRDLAREWLYKFRKGHYNDADAHFQYIGYFFMKERDTEDEFKHDEVISGTVVSIETKFGTTRFLIHDGPTDIEKSELNIEHENAKHLLGKRVGDVTNIGKVTEIKDKYIDALLKSQELFPTQFPGFNKLQKFSFDEKNPDAFVDQLRQQTKKRRETVESIEKLYRENKLTVEAFALLLGSNAVEVYYAIRQTGFVPIKTFLGGSKEIGEAQQLGKSCLVVDMTALVTVHELGMIEHLAKQYGKLLVARSVVDDLDRYITELGDTGPDGTASIANVNGQLIHTEVDGKAIAARLETAKKLRVTIDQHCDIKPIKGALEVNRSKLDEYERVLGKGSADTILLATGEKRILFSDDRLLRLLAEQELGVKGVWTQPLLLNLLEAKLIAQEEYDEVLIELISKHYQYVSFNAKTIVAAAKQAGWAPGPPLVTTLDAFKDSDIDIGPLLNIAAQFLYEVWKQPGVDVVRRNALLAALLVRLLARDGANKPTLVAELNKRVEIVFRLWQTASDDVVRNIRTISSTLY